MALDSSTLLVLLLLLLSASGNPVKPAPGKHWPSPHPHKNTCNKPAIRQEWRILPDTQKAAYINAVLCLQKLPAKSKYPGAKSRYQDFTAMHIVNTPAIHFNGIFLPWHRYFLQLWENALRDECGYKGYLPFWDMGIDTHNITAAPVFDPVTGFGGDGGLVDSGPIDINFPPFPEIVVPKGAGGGCITNGPFKDYVATLGPGPSTAYNPRCLKRDVNQYVATHYSSLTEVAALENSPDWISFNKFYIDYFPIDVHTAGHLTIGGDVANLYSSPTEPLFYLHHANLDRLWWQWQNEKLPHRLFEMGGPVEGFGLPNSTNITLETVFDVTAKGLPSKPISIGDLMSTVNGELCYVYQYF